MQDFECGFLSCPTHTHRAIFMTTLTESLTLGVRVSSSHLSDFFFFFCLHLRVPPAVIDGVFYLYSIWRPLVRVLASSTCVSFVAFVRQCCCLLVSWALALSIAITSAHCCLVTIARYRHLTVGSCYFDPFLPDGHFLLYTFGHLQTFSLVIRLCVSSISASPSVWSVGRSVNAHYSDQNISGCLIIKTVLVLFAHSQSRCVRLFVMMCRRV